MAAVVTYIDQRPNSQGVGVTRGTIGSLVVSYLTHTDGIAISEAIPFKGTIRRIIANPTDAHTTLWDATIIDKDGLDLAGGLLANLHVTDTNEVVPLIGTTHLVSYEGTLVVNITNAGSGKNGVITIYYE